MHNYRNFAVHWSCEFQLSFTSLFFLTFRYFVFRRAMAVGNINFFKRPSRPYSASVVLDDSSVIINCRLLIWQHLLVRAWLHLGLALPVRSTEISLSYSLISPALTVLRTWNIRLFCFCILKYGLFRDFHTKR